MGQGTPTSGREQQEPDGRDEHAASRLVTLAVRRAKDGDGDAFAFLYTRYSDDVCRYATSIVRNRHEAEDITQETFTKLFRIIDKYEERDVPFLAWMLRVTRNVAVDRVRRQRTVPVAEVRGHAGAAEWDPSSTRALTAALSELSFAQREVLLLRHLVGLTPAEIAERIGRSEGSVHGLHHRGRKALVKHLASRGVTPVTQGAHGRVDALHDRSPQD